MFRTDSGGAGLGEYVQALSGGPKIMSGDADADATLAIVMDCWSRTLPSIPPDPDRSWDETGADSMAGLQLLLRLERALGRHVPADLLSPAMTPAHLAASLDRCAEPADARPHMFLLPGLLGDEPRLGRFRNALAGHIRFTLLDLPDVESPASVIGDIERCARIAADRLESQQPEGAISIAGYSIGGVVALATAALLGARGREIALLVLLDPLLRVDLRKPLRLESGAPPDTGPLASIAGPGGRTRSWREQRDRMLFGILFLGGALEACRRRLFEARETLPPATYYWRRLRLIGRLRGRALRRWRPERHPGPTLLFVSDEAAEHYDLAIWDRLCPARTTINLGGAHLGLFRPEALERIAASLTAAFDRTRP